MSDDLGRRCGAGIAVLICVLAIGACSEAVRPTAQSEGGERTPTMRLSSTRERVVDAQSPKGEQQIIRDDEPPTLPPAPASIEDLGESSDGLVTLAAASRNAAVAYRLYWSLRPRPDLRRDPMRVMPAPEMTLFGGGKRQGAWFQIAAVWNDGSVEPVEEARRVEGSDLDALCTPPWALGLRLETRHHAYDPALAASDNGARLAAAIASLQPGQRLLVGSGTYELTESIVLPVSGRADAPIVIEAAEPHDAIITSSDAKLHLMNLGADEILEYVAIRGLTFTGGARAIAFGICRHLWVDGCRMMALGQGGTIAQTGKVEACYLTRNEISRVKGNGMSFGLFKRGRVQVAMAKACVIAGNHIHDISGKRSGGIVIHQGSAGNLLHANQVHDTRYPCILVYGSGGGERNRVENNLCFRSADVTMQIQGEAIVRNNLVIGGSTAFTSKDHTDATRDLEVVHNTFVNQGASVVLQGWDQDEGHVFANNVCYSASAAAIELKGDALAIVGNVVLGTVSPAIAHLCRPGLGLQDFAGLSWDGKRRDARPAPGSAIAGSGDPTYLHPWDRDGELRLECAAGSQAASMAGAL